VLSLLFRAKDAQYNILYCPLQYDLLKRGGKMKKVLVASHYGADPVVRSVRWMRYSPLCCPLYYLLVLAISLLTFIIIRDAVIFSGVVFTALMALRWKCFVFWDQRAAIISSRRVFVRGVTPTFGFPISKVIMSNLFQPPLWNYISPYRFTFTDGRPASKIFLADNFSFLSLSWRTKISNLGEHYGDSCKEFRGQYP